MAPLIPIETLSYYLSKTGITKFKLWFNSIELFKPIHEELEELTNTYIKMQNPIQKTDIKTQNTQTQIPIQSFDINKYKEFLINKKNDINELFDEYDEYELNTIIQNDIKSKDIKSKDIKSNDTVKDHLDIKSKDEIENELDITTLQYNY